MFDIVGVHVACASVSIIEDQAENFPGDRINRDLRGFRLPAFQAVGEESLEIWADRG